MLPIKKISGEEHLLTGIPQINRKRKVNGDKTISFSVVPQENNVHSWDSIINETAATFQNESYTFKQVGEKNVGQRSVKEVEAVHTFFSSMIGCFQDKVHSGSMTFANALKFVFEQTNYSYSIVDTINAQTLDNFGNDNCLALFQKLLESYSVEFRIVGNQVYLQKQIGADTGFQFRWKHNVKGLNKVENTNNLSTYIKGYGKLKEQQDVLSTTAIPYGTRQGTFTKEATTNDLVTTDVGALFKFTFTGTGFRFKTRRSTHGGVWKFVIDGSQTKTISTYYKESDTFTYEIARGLENKQYTVAAIFEGADSKNPHTSKGTNIKPLVYLMDGNIIEPYRELIGDERYEAVAEHTSPNAALYPNPGHPQGLHVAAPIYDERITSKDTLLALLKKNMQDSPELSITVDIAELGLDNGALNEGDRGYIIYEPMKLTIGVRIVEIDETYQYFNKQWRLVKTQVTLSNSRTKLTDVTTKFSQTSKHVDRLISGNEKLPFDSMAEAVARATKVLQSAQTELEFINGIIARDKLDSNRIVLLNSGGLGISNDGGAMFKTAITGDGIVADVITTGTLRAILIEGVEIYGSLFESAVSPMEFIRIQGSRFESRGTYSRKWRGSTNFHDVSMRFENGFMRARNNTSNGSLYYSDFGVSTQVDGDADGSGSSGTLEFFTGEYSEVDASGITLSSYGGVVALRSDVNRIVLDASQSINLESKKAPIFIRPNIEKSGYDRTFAFTYSSDSEDSYLMYGATNNYHSGLRFFRGGDRNTVALVNGNYERGGDTLLDAGNIATNTIYKRDGSRSVYWNGSATGTTGGTSANETNTLYASGIRTANGDSDLFLATDKGGTVRITDAFGYNSGNGITYRQIAASEFVVASSLEYKKNIEDYAGNALDLINGTKVRSYHMNDEIDDVDYKHIGLIVQEAPMEIVNMKTGDAIDTYAMISIMWKSIQELSSKITELESV